MGVLDGFKLREPVQGELEAPVSEISPELIAALTSFLAAQSARGEDPITSRARIKTNGRMDVDPRSIIRLDDAEFGRY